jgi:hypothetical protein
MLFIVVDRARWGKSVSVIRAENEDEALRLAGVSKPGDPRVEVFQLLDGGPSAVLWCEDESPDTPRDRD